jgi:HEXXH motif-containing protein
MTMRIHTLSHELFSALAEGGGGKQAVQVLAEAQYSKHLLLLRGVVSEAEAGSAEHARLVSDSFALLAAVADGDKAAARRVLRYPAVGAWLLRTLRGLRGGTRMAGAEPAGLSALAAAAAVQAGMPTEAEVWPVDGVVVLPSLGVAITGHPTVTVVVSGGEPVLRAGHDTIRITPGEAGTGPGWLPLRHISTGAFDVLVDDLDPFRMPAVAGVASRLPISDIISLRRAIGEGWRLLEARHPQAAEEVRSAIQVLVPLNKPSDGQVSSSTPETFGAIALSVPPDPWTCAVTLAHEVQHMKLSALLDIYPLTRPDDGRRYYAPWRQDPRPLDGLLQGAYAYIAVCEFWRRERALARGPVLDRANQEFALWRMGTERAVRAIRASGHLTPHGEAFLAGMAKTASSWRDDLVSAAAERHAHAAAQRHITRWQKENGSVPT